jgi:hypothetical protein
MVLVIALAKLHNYCINANDNDSSANTARDEWASEINCAVPLVPVEDHGEGSPKIMLILGLHCFATVKVATVKVCFVPTTTPISRIGTGIPETTLNFC